jgi:penicillin-binding protein 2
MGNLKNLFNAGSRGLTGGELKGKFKKRWVEESITLENSRSRKNDTATTGAYLGSSINYGRIKFFFIITIVCFTVIIGKVFILQVVNGYSYLALAEGNRIRIRPIPAERGILFDRNNVALVENIPSFTLAIAPQDLPIDKKERLDTISQLSQISGVPKVEINELLKKYGSYSLESLILRENLDYNTAIELYVENAHLPGVVIESTTRRKYLTKSNEEYVESLSHLLGYLGKLSEEELADNEKDGYRVSDTIGKIGLEQSYEKILRGNYGEKKIEVDALGREQTVLAVEPPQLGKNIVLTLDVEAQQVLETEIKKSITKVGKQKFAALALDPNNGEIIAMVSYPPYNNNDFSAGISQQKYQEYSNNVNKPLFNRAIGGTYPPGSTIKPIIAAAALEEKIVSRNTSFSSTGGIQVGRWFFKDWKPGGHGATAATKAIAWSVNTYFYYIGGGFGNFEGLGLEKISTYLRSFSVGSATGIDIPNENSGFVPSRQWKIAQKNEPWFVGDTYNLAIGQGDLLVTPLQVAVWTSAVATGGIMPTPHLAKQIIDTTSAEVTNIELSLKRNPFVSKNPLEIAKIGMVECGKYGSCGLLRTLSFTSGGKTGTAQWSSTKDTHAWFTAFAPTNDPKIVVTVLVEEGGEGAEVAMPIATNFLRWWGNKYLTN